MARLASKTNGGQFDNKRCGMEAIYSSSGQDDKSGSDKTQANENAKKSRNI